MIERATFEIDLPRDENGRVVGYGVGKEAAMRDWRFRKENRDFEKLVVCLRAVKWNRANPGRRRTIQAKYNAKPERREAQNSADRARRARAFRASPEVFTCAECGSTWCRVPWARGPKPTYCGAACYQRAKYQAATPGARRTKRRGARS